GMILGRAPLRFGRGLVTGGVLAAFLAASVLFWQKLDIANKAGAQGAAARIDIQRQPGEPVVICSPLLYYAVLFHAEDRAGWFLYDDGRELRHDLGTAVLTPDVWVTPEQLKATEARRLWVVDLAGGDYFGRHA